MWRAPTEEPGGVLCPKEDRRRSFGGKPYGLALTSGRTRRELAEDLGIGLSTLTRWVGRERDVGEPVEASTDLLAELKRLRRENAVLRLERDILKKKPQPSSRKTDRPPLSGPVP